jgi:hypothetical protein
MSYEMRDELMDLGYYNDTGDADSAGGEDLTQIERDALAVPGLGSEGVYASNAGGEALFGEEDLESIVKTWYVQHLSYLITFVDWYSHVDSRRRLNRVQDNVNKWRNQMDQIIEGYLHWKAYGAPTGTDQSSPWELYVVSFEHKCF